MRARFYLYGFLMCCVCGQAAGQAIDTVAVISAAVWQIKGSRSTCYSYVMDGWFPGSQQDHIKGKLSVQMDERLYLNDCDAFVLLCTPEWLYKADHRRKTVEIIHLASQRKDKKLKAMTDDIFKEGELAFFLDSVVSAKARLKKWTMKGNIEQLTLDFPKGSALTSMSIELDDSSHTLRQCSVKTMHPWQRTAKGIESIETSMKCSEFSSSTDKAIFDEQRYFTYMDGKVSLLKYRNYKLTTTM